MKFKVITYHISLIDQLNREVENYLNSGWKLHGSVVVNDRNIFATITKQEF